MKLDMKIQIKKDFQHFNEMVLISRVTFFYRIVSCHPSVVYVLIYTNWLKTRYNIKCMQI